MNQGTSTILMLVVLFAIMYFLMIRPENKRKKKAQEMRDSLKKGDVITTIGGIVGKIVQVNNETIVIETSDDRVRMELTKWAVSTVGVQTGEQPAADKDDKKKKEKEKEKEEPAVEAPAKEEEPAEEPVDEIPAPEEEKN
ncbi:MAG: preprotein translocase subunit YajC [Dysosmobacter sp.]